MKLNNGFSMIEMMISVMIFGILAMAGTYYSGDFIKKEKAEQSLLASTEAVTIARNTALRNLKKISSGIHTYMIVEGNELCVVNGEHVSSGITYSPLFTCQYDSPSKEEILVWRTSIPAKIKLEGSEYGTGCIAFNTYGLSESSSLDGFNCSTSFNAEVDFQEYIKQGELL